MSPKDGAAYEMDKRTTNRNRNKVYDARFTYDLHIRLTRDEYEILTDKSRRTGCNVSQAARSLLFRNANASLDGATAGQVKHMKLLALRAARDECRKMTALFENVLSVYNRNVEAGLTDDERTQRFLVSVAEVMENVRRVLNRCLVSEGEKEEERPEAVGRVLDDTDKLKTKYSNMERVMIIGTLAEDAVSYKTKDGVEKLKLKILCESAGKGGVRVVRNYTAFTRSVDAAPFLVKGADVFAEGDYAEGSEGEKLVFADVIRTTGGGTGK